MIDQENTSFHFALRFNSYSHEKNKTTTDVDLKFWVENLFCQIWVERKGKIGKGQQMLPQILLVFSWKWK